MNLCYSIINERKQRKKVKKMRLTMTSEDYNSVFLNWIRDELEQKNTINFVLLGREWDVCHYYWRDEYGEDVDYMLISVDNEFEGILERKELYTLVETLTKFNKYEY